jgi:hypothetical protein
MFFGAAMATDINVFDNNIDCTDYGEMSKWIPKLESICILVDGSRLCKVIHKQRLQVYYS